MEQAFNKRLRFILMGMLSALVTLSAAACEPADLNSLDNTLSESATLVAVVSEEQPAQSARATSPAAAPIKKPTRAATKVASRIKNTPGDFDFYVLVLSWSPDYCAGSNVDDPQQCSVGKKLSFVLHGLWPQYTRGYPSDCSHVTLPKDVQAKFPHLYPNTQLYTHEWNKHGTCSGLKPAAYLALSKTLKDSLAIPQAYQSPAQVFRTTVDDLKTEFIEANPMLNEEGLAVQCSGSGRFLKELYVCFSREGQPIACSAEIQKDAAKSCGQADFLVRNVK